MPVSVPVAVLDASTINLFISTKDTGKFLLFKLNPPIVPPLPSETEVNNTKSP
tara:strand:+ start:746 stop:904 length:159 start_codon:yes stop_codon:yes gene_type:complete